MTNRLSQGDWVNLEVTGRQFSHPAITPNSTSSSSGSSTLARWRGWVEIARYGEMPISRIEELMPWASAQRA